MVRALACLVLASLLVSACEEDRRTGGTTPGADVGGGGGGGSKDATIIGGGDTGVTPPDTGVTPADTGVGPADTGVDPVDSGVDPTDTGVDPTDTGVDPTDTGVLVDTGVETPEAGVDPDAGVAADAAGGDAGPAEDAALADAGGGSDASAPADAAPAEDAATGADAQPMADAATGVDAAPMADATPSDTGLAEDAAPADSGVVADAGTAIDAGAPVDAGPGIDAGAMDGGVVATCVGALPVPASGTAMGTTAGNTDDYVGGCHSTGGPDELFTFTAPGALVSLEVDTVGSTFDTALHVYGASCDVAGRLACNDDAVGTRSRVTLTNRPAGPYHVVVDGFGTSNGDYVLNVRGVLAAGEVCDPAQTYLSCELGTCSAAAGGGFRCPSLRDCIDGFDADDDGTIDEDAASCVMPPVVTCPPSTVIPVLSNATLTATASDDGTIVGVGWRVLSGPMGSTAQPVPNDFATTQFQPLLTGTYEVLFTAVDDLGHLSACATTVTATITDILRIELLWNLAADPATDQSDLDLHLLHPQAPAWFDNTLDCYYSNCVGTPLPWGGTSTDDDPRLDIDDVDGRGPENTNILSPELGVPYRIGVHYYDDDGFGPSTAVVNVFCGGQLAGTFGPVTLANGNLGSRQGNDFWRVADVTFTSSTGCTLTDLSVAGVPSVVTASTAGLRP